MHQFRVQPIILSFVLYIEITWHKCVTHSDLGGISGFEIVINCNLFTMVEVIECNVMLCIFNYMLLQIINYIIKYLN